MKNLKILQKKYKQVYNEALVNPDAIMKGQVPTQQSGTTQPISSKNDNAPVPPEQLKQTLKTQGLDIDKFEKAPDPKQLEPIINNLLTVLKQKDPKIFQELQQAASSGEPVKAINRVLSKYPTLFSSLNEAATTAGTGVLNKISSLFTSLFNFFKKNKTNIITGTLGLLTMGPIGAIALPLLTKALREGGTFGKKTSGDDRDESFEEIIINDPTTSADIEKLIVKDIKNLNLKGSTPRAISNRNIPSSLKLSDETLANLKNNPNHSVNIIDQIAKHQYQLKYKGGLYTFIPVYWSTSNTSTSSPSTTAEKGSPISSSTTAKKGSPIPYTNKISSNITRILGNGKDKATTLYGLDGKAYTFTKNDKKQLLGITSQAEWDKVNSKLQNKIKMLPESNLKFKKTYHKVLKEFYKNND